MGLFGTARFLKSARMVVSRNEGGTSQEFHQKGQDKSGIETCPVINELAGMSLAELVPLVGG